MLALQAENRTTPFINANPMRKNVVSIDSAKQAAQQGSLTEIVVQDDNYANMPMLMPLLAQLSQDNRWLVWVSPPSSLPKQLLVEAGIDLSKVIQLNPDDKHSTLTLAKQALETGTSHAVISWSTGLSEEEFATLESAAEKGCSHGIVIRRRQHS